MPDLSTVVVSAHGFSDLLNELDFMRTIRAHNAEVVSDARASRALVAAQATALGALEQRDQTLTDAVEAQRDQVAALQAALLNQQLAELTRRAAKSAVLHGVEAKVSSLEAAQIKLDGEASPDIGGIQIDTGGMVQPPPGAPAAVAQIMAAGNAIATLPYIWGGGHASFHADGYDCSGSVSYVLAAAGLLTSPEVAADFESYGDPGPGRWITIWASGSHVFMYVAGWRFDTIALAETGTRWSRTAGDTGGFVARHPPGL
jgi:cell wall-associated NlpC family hydrolase